MGNIINMMTSMGLLMFTQPVTSWWKQGTSGGESNVVQNIQRLVKSECYVRGISNWIMTIPNIQRISKDGITRYNNQPTGLLNTSEMK